jgi:hypothetical protein
MNQEKYEQELLELHKQVGDAYLNKDVGFFTKDIANDYFSISRGKYIKPTRSKITQIFENYLNITEFKVYESLMDPIVTVSDDGTLGWVVAQVKIQAKRELEGLSHEVDEIWTWITLYKRQNGNWIRMGEVNSTSS